MSSTNRALQSQRQVRQNHAAAVSFLEPRIGTQGQLFLTNILVNIVRSSDRWNHSNVHVTSEYISFSESLDSGLSEIIHLLRLAGRLSEGAMRKITWFVLVIAIASLFRARDHNHVRYLWNGDHKIVLHLHAVLEHISLIAAKASRTRSLCYVFEHCEVHRYCRCTNPSLIVPRSAT